MWKSSSLFLFFSFFSYTFTHGKRLRKVRSEYPFVNRLNITLIVHLDLNFISSIAKIYFRNRTDLLLKRNVTTLSVHYYLSYWQMGFLFVLFHSLSLLKLNEIVTIILMYNFFGISKRKNCDYVVKTRNQWNNFNSTRRRERKKDSKMY